jgi:hypothetical protein
MTPQPKTLPRDHFLASDPNYVSWLVWGVLLYFAARRWRLT